MNYCQKEEFLSKLVQRDLGDFYSTPGSTSFSNIRGIVKKKVRS